MKSIPNLHPYPLAWPDKWPRHTGARVKALFKTTLARAVNNLETELERMGATHLTVTSNMALGAQSPVDPGVAVHFMRGQRLHILACDKFAKVEWNMQALARTVEALRQIQRDGASEILERALGGFQRALAAPPGANEWWGPLGLDHAPVNIQEAEDAFKRMALEAHPDRGGRPGQMQALLEAREHAHQKLPSGRTAH